MIRPTGLRIAGQRRGPPVRFDFEGQTIEAFAGETLAAALLAAGAQSGLFCAMGICQECLLLVDGSITESCRTMVRPGMIVRRAP